MTDNEESRVPIPTWQVGANAKGVNHEIGVGGDDPRSQRGRKKKSKGKEKVRGRGVAKARNEGNANGGNEYKNNPGNGVINEVNELLAVPKISKEDSQRKKHKRSKGKGRGRRPQQERNVLKQVDQDIVRLDGAQLYSAFERARVHMGEVRLKVQAADLLLLYGLYKQITEGDNKDEKPNPTKFVASQKWIAWKARKGTDRETAMKLYIYNVRKLDPSFDFDDMEDVETTIEESDDIEGFKSISLNDETPQPRKEEFERFLQSRQLSIRFSGANGSRLSNNIQVDAHKSFISEYDVRRYTMIKMQKQSQSVRFSSIPSPKPASFKIPEVDAAKAYALIKEVIDRIAAKIKKETSDKLTDDTFSGTEKPAIGLPDFIFRMVRYLDRWFNNKPGFGSAGFRSLLISTVYLERIKARVGDFALTEYNVHRLFAVCMLLGAKFGEDYIIANSYWAEVAGIEMKELNTIEENFCNLCGFDLYISDDKLKQLYETYTSSYFEAKV